MAALVARQHAEEILVLTPAQDLQAPFRHGAALGLIYQRPARSTGNLDREREVTRTSAPVPDSVRRPATHQLLRIPPAGEDSPIVLLRSIFRAWRIAPGG
jgi:hypothetical protein